MTSSCVLLIVLCITEWTEGIAVPPKIITRSDICVTVLYSLDYNSLIYICQVQDSVMWVLQATNWAAPVQGHSSRCCRLLSPVSVEGCYLRVQYQL